MSKRPFHETCQNPAANAAVVAKSADHVVPPIVALTAPPWCYNRIVRLTERYVREFALPESALNALAVAKFPDEQVVGEWTALCCKGELALFPWTAVIFEADCAEGEYYAISDPDAPCGGRYDLEVADPRLPLITKELAAMYVTVVADFVGKAMLMNEEQRAPILKKYEAHWGYSAINNAVKAMHTGIQSPLQIVTQENLERHLMEVWHGQGTSSS